MTAIFAGIGWLVIKIFERENKPNVTHGNYTINQTTNSGAATIHTGQGHIYIGLTLEDHEKRLRHREREIREELEQKHSSDRQVLQIELQHVQQQLNDIQASYETQITILKERIAQLEKLRETYPDEFLNQAIAALKEGNSQKADLLFKQIEDDNNDAIKLIAESAYQRGKIAEEQIRYNDALNHFDRAFRLIPENKSYLTALAFINLQMGFYQKAIFYTEQELANDLITYGNEHPFVARDYNTLGEVWRLLGDYPKSLDYFKKALDIQLKILGENDSNIARVRNNIGLVLDNMGEYADAINYFEIALKSDLLNFGENHPEVAQTRNNLSCALIKYGKHELAFKCYSKALKSLQKCYGNNHPSVAITLGNIGSALKSIGNSLESIDLFTQSLNIFLKFFDDNHPYIATTRNNLGEAWISQGDNFKAISYLEPALRSSKKMYGDYHPLVAGIQNNLGNAWYKLGEYQKAIDYLEPASVTAIKLLGINHPNTKLVIRNLESARNKLKNIE